MALLNDRQLKDNYERFKGIRWVNGKPELGPHIGALRMVQQGVAEALYLRVLQIMDKLRLSESLDEHKQALMEIAKVMEDAARVHLRPEGME